jgi:DNA polymerase-3 subunit gamma/tau
LAHAFMLTGVRGIGKTTTARILARAFNCANGPTDAPCGVCEHCTAIAEDRHVDVIEMDAASHNGVDDIREVIEGVLYRPSSARFKVYIIDEVHMLSNQAFNALLKTLEEPPEHVKFIFATTEIRKVPITVLSRCQKFALRRVSSEAVQGRLMEIAIKEGVSIEPNALSLISKAGDGSVRDSLSLFDQAIALGGMDISHDLVSEMLGLPDRESNFLLLESALSGDTRASLSLVQRMILNGADPVIVLGGLLELVHRLVRGGEKLCHRSGAVLALRAG